MKNETQAIPEAKKQNPFFAWVRKNAVMCIALLAAIVTATVLPYNFTSPGVIFDIIFYRL